MEARTEPAKAEPAGIRRPPLIRELLLVAGLFLVHKLGRQLATGHSAEAFHVIHLTFPPAPPRLLGEAGLIDTGQVFGPTVLGASPEADTLTNHYWLDAIVASALPGIALPVLHLPHRTESTAGQGSGRGSRLAAVGEPVLVGAGR